MKNNRFPLFVLGALFILLGACAPQKMEMEHTKVEIPVDKGYAEGSEIYFIHPEVSDARLAEKMGTGMDLLFSMFRHWRKSQIILWRTSMCSPTAFQE